MSFVRDAPMVGQEYMWDGDGEELGSLKNEADELFDEPTSHPEYSAESSISFDDARICALKMYCLTKAVPGEESKTIMRMKGFCKKNQVLTDKSEDAMKLERGMSDEQIKAATHDLGVADYDRMLSGKGVCIQQEQEQFRCPITNHCNESKFMHTLSIRVVKQQERGEGGGIQRGDGSTADDGSGRTECRD